MAKCELWGWPTRADTALPQADADSMMVRWAVRHNVPIAAVSDADFAKFVKYGVPKSAEGWTAKFSTVHRQMVARVAASVSRKSGSLLVDGGESRGMGTVAIGFQTTIESERRTVLCRLIAHVRLRH